MMGKFTAVADIVSFALPSCSIKFWILRRLGHVVSKTGVAFGPCLVWRCGKFRVGSGSSIGPGNVFKGLASVDIGSKVIVGRLNWFAADARINNSSCSGQLSVGDHAGLTSWHHVDCCGGVRIGAFTTVGGRNVTVLSHEINFRENEQRSRPVVIGDYCFIGTGATLLSGSMLPDKSVLGAGSVLTKSASGTRSGLYAGVPAKWVKVMTGHYFDRLHGVVDPATEDRLPGA